MAATTFEQLRAALNEATNKIADRLQALHDKLDQSGISAADEQAAIDALLVEVDRLHAMGTDPANPVPPVTDPPIV